MCDCGACCTQCGHTHDCTSLQPATTDDLDDQTADLTDTDYADHYDLPW